MNLIKSITISSVKALQPGDTIRDPVVRGFGARYRHKTITYFVHTRIHNRQRWVTIGKHGNPWTPELARIRAKEILHSAQQGIDLNAVATDVATLTFEDVFDRYSVDSKNHLKPSTHGEYTRLANTILLPFFKDKPFPSLTRDDILNLQRSLARTPSNANHVLALAKSIFNWAEAQNIPGPVKNPCLHIKKFKRQGRARFLTIDDLGRLAEAIRTALSGGIATPIQVSAILLLLFTGARRGEIFTLKRSYVDRQRMIAHLPDSKTGAKVLHLNAHAMAILDSIPETEGNPYYLVGRFTGTCITEIKKPWDKIRKMAKLEGFRLHDFRHSYASFAADTGATANAIGDLLGHASIETTKLYIHLFNSRAKEASEATGTALHAIISRPSLPPPSSHASSPKATHSDLSGHTGHEPFFPPQCG